MNLPVAYLEVKIVFPIRDRGGPDARLCVGILRCRFIFHPSVRVDPIHFPGFSALLRECLLKVTRVRSDLRYDKADQDHPSIKEFLIEEFAPAILEFAGRGLAQAANLAIRKIEAPLPGLRI